MNAHELLIAALAMIPTPNDWTKGVDARDANGDPVEAGDPDAVCYCALGAIERNGNAVSPWEYTKAVLALEAAIPEGFRLEVFEYQDLPEITHADVLALYGRAIAATAETA
jgi:hypothetical protein